MIGFIIRRLLTLIPLLLGITMLVFILMSLAPGDFLTPVKAQRDVPIELIQAIEIEFGLDQPWYVQYVKWLGNVFEGNLGHSWAYKLPVSDLIGQRLFATFLLSVCAFVFSWGIAIPLGVLAAIYKDSIFDRISAGLAYAALSVPEFFLALLLVFFAAQTGWFPMGGATSIEYEYMGFFEKIADRGHHLILPTLALGIGSIASIMRIMRANFLDTIRAGFVTTARAKGLSEFVVMFKHALRNAINPLVSAFGFAFSGLLSGALMVEIVLQYPGLGQLMYQSILREDQFVVLASVMMGCTMLVLGNLLADILLAWSDPRIRLEKKK
ncbi:MULTISPECIES: ABC transporter permease [unclassified Lentimonas]|uniref:ABC transporter permease n=1 Tax=unclassified Lentimonas TaxID=2630993 RepID=UPI0013278438|nr:MULTISPECIES: ABC transporter permease [unclassified Lentimonas]CAA6678117.1 Oligopeptide transport system permease protein OppB (TC 3.A.1.5.1) [Lentimonas sp. CC4]CAA6685994.1 Oligopeptide transport system permease protein OppB (TC 3.A.1.5.1) [Lentimonas sp. CC6]CAA7075917.1 Oligopeptide transport system permease protein OppB (TC 3.A.1.5.1) [Lentimonas sp. CC4]CAA7168656.1 Oligopeptide transport system permease protein OppB (TC 3.A.1.5.1) [Lentimonas sp. CC21]CAA7181048.1 Oligopeptide tran